MKLGILSFVLLSSGCICQSITHPIVRDQGKIERVLLYELRSDGSLHDTNGSALADSLVSIAGLKVCLVRNVLCSADEITTATFCKTKFSPWIPRAIDKVGRDVERLAPFQLDGPFTLVEMNGEAMDFKDLTALERIEFLTSGEADESLLRWDSNSYEWKSQNGSMIVRSPQEFSGVDKENARKYLADGDTSWLRISKQLYVGNASIDGAVYEVDWRSVCRDESISYKDCFNLLMTDFNDYAQDEFHARSNALTARVRPSEPVLLNMRRQRHASQLCTSQSHPVSEELPMKGGNYFFMDGMVFIGSDELRNFKRCSNWAGKLGLDTTASTKEIEKALVERFDEEGEEKFVIWLGDTVNRLERLNCSSRIPESGTQPIFHIDMFFHPLYASGDTVHYLFALPQDSLHKTGNWSEHNWETFKIIKDGLEIVEKQVKQILSDNRMVPKPCYIPLLVNFHDGQSNAGFVSFANGLVSAKDGHILYLMPDYDNGVSHFSNVLYTEALTITKEALRKINVPVDVIKGGYEELSALHCKVKVLKRE
jgi:hypothetical protein